MNATARVVDIRPSKRTDELALIEALLEIYPGKIRERAARIMIVSGIGVRDASIDDWRLVLMLAQKGEQS